MPNPSEYWRLDSLSGGKYVGSILGTQLTPTNVTSVAGIISNGAGGSTPSVTPALVSPSTGVFAIGSTGMSLTGWFYQVSGPFLISDGPSFLISYGSGKSTSLGLSYFTPNVTAACGTTVGNGGGLSSASSLGVWVFLAVTLDRSTKTFRFYVNGSPDSSVVLTGTVSVEFFGVIQIRLSTIAGTSSIVDEVGYWSNAILSDGDVSDLWNGGLGQRPPGG